MHIQSVWFYYSAANFLVPNIQFYSKVSAIPRNSTIFSLHTSIDSNSSVSNNMQKFWETFPHYSMTPCAMLSTVVISSQPLNLLLSHTNIMEVLLESQLFYHVMILNKVFSFGKKIKFAYRPTKCKF